MEFVMEAMKVGLLICLLCMWRLLFLLVPVGLDGENRGEMINVVGELNYF
jgi:hypothetical protein